VEENGWKYSWTRRLEGGNHGLLSFGLDLWLVVREGGGEDLGDIVPVHDLRGRGDVGASRSGCCVYAALTADCELKNW
jgi:hypothetical protein